MFISTGKEVLFRVVISPDINATMGHHKVKIKDFIDLKSKISWLGTGTLISKRRRG
jgi:hypothetical protein